MIQIDQMKVSVERLKKVVPGELLKRGWIGTEEKALVKQVVSEKMQISLEQIKELQILKKSLDARKKEEIYVVYQVEFSCASKEQERKLWKRYPKKELRMIDKQRRQKDLEARDENFDIPFLQQNEKKRPLVIGFGPAGLFAALTLARAGLAPIVAERGMRMEKRQKCVEQFWKTGVLNPESNVQFGEGGAGTFSDGKLNTMVKDKTGRNKKVLETFVEFGAPEEILYLQKPHIGTDRLRNVVENLREEIVHLGGTVLFETKLVDIQVENSVLRRVILEQEGKCLEQDCSALILAVGHSARDTFLMLKERKVQMEPKAFAVGVRMEHPQEMIGESQYGRFYKDLPAADYKLTYQTLEKRGVYSFCMCPGGFVVNASSEKNRLAVNGMSNYLRDGKNANSAIVVTVSPEDFGTGDVFSGMEFQRRYESAAYQEASGKIPVQLFADFMQGKKSTGFGAILPQMKGAYDFGNLRNILPEFVSQSLQEGILAFGKKIRGYDREDAILSGIESRTSSPIRMLRDECYMSNIKGIYPCGEGAGYAGGITSAAMDGIRVAEQLISV